MRLDLSDFKLTDAELVGLNEAIDRTVKEIYTANPDEDPLDAMSVVFTFVPGFGRQIEVQIGGRTTDVD